MLLENEMIKFDGSNPIDAVFTDEEIDEKYVKGEVRIVTEQARYPLNAIPGMIKSAQYELNPDFQRRRRWSDEKRSRLIESFIMNVPIPPVFLYENDLSHYEVMDGLQRLSTICDFYEDKFQLQGLQLWSELNGRRYSELPEKVKKGIDRRYISSIILLQESAKTEEEAQRMKQLVFERINSGGVSLEPQETRNALYDGKMNRLCIELSRNKYLCRFLQLPDSDSEADRKTLESIEMYKKMEDVEFVLRFFAMRQLEGYANLKLHPFLDFYLDKANGFSDIVIQDLREIFETTIQFAYVFLGEYAFKMYRPRKKPNGTIVYAWSNRIATTIYDPMMQVLSEMLDNQELYLKIDKDLLIERLQNFYKLNDEMFGGRNNGKMDIERRISAFKDFFAEIVK